MHWREPVNVPAFQEILKILILFLCRFQKEKRKRMLIDELPPVLFIHVLSAEYDRTLQNTKKIIKKFTFDVDLEIGKEMLSAKAKSKIPNSDRFYKLLAGRSKD